MLSITFSSDTASSTTMTLPKSSSSPAEVRHLLAWSPGPQHGPSGGYAGGCIYCKPPTNRGFLPAWTACARQTRRRHGFKAFGLSGPVLGLSARLVTTGGRPLGDAHCQDKCP